MSNLLLVRGNGPHSFSAVNAGTDWDYSVTGEDLFPSETVQGSMWMADSGCTITNVVVDDTKVIDGNTYANVITARISGFTSGIEAVTTLTFVGDSSAQERPFEIRIPVAE